MRFTFKAMFPHFATRTKPDGKVEAFSASDKPVDPWVQLEQDRGDGVPRKVFLSARQPVVSDHLNQPNLPEGARLRYVREGEEPQWRFAVFTKSDKRVRLLEDGRVKREEPFDVNRVFVVEKGLSITPLALWEHAEYQADFRPHPDPALASRYLHPALKLRLTDLATGECESRWLDIADPRRIDTGTRMLGGRVGLVLRQRRMEPKAMFSDLNILDTQGNTLARKVVGLGDPLLHAGFKLYQIGSGMEGGESSTILIMREPGRPLIITGLLLLLAGACWMFHLKPWFKERESASMKVAP
jgi:hypothetical protein